MPRERSVATENRDLRRQLKSERRLASEWERQARVYKTQATKLAGELSEWKARFDALLGIVGKTTNGG